MFPLFPYSPPSQPNPNSKPLKIINLSSDQYQMLLIYRNSPPHSNYQPIYADSQHFKKFT